MERGGKFEIERERGRRRGKERKGERRERERRSKATHKPSMNSYKNSPHFHVVQSS